MPLNVISIFGVTILCIIFLPKVYKKLVKQHEVKVKLEDSKIDQETAQLVKKESKKISTKDASKNKKIIRDFMEVK